RPCSNLSKQCEKASINRTILSKMRSAETSWRQSRKVIIGKAQVGPGTATSFLYQTHLASSSNEERGSYRMGRGIQPAKDGSSRTNSLGFGIIEANRTVLICGARSLGRNRWRVEPIRYNCLRSSLRTC